MSIARPTTRSADPLRVLVVVLSLIAAGEYLLIAISIVPRLARIAGVQGAVLLVARWGATAFFVGCAITHTVIAVDTLLPSADWVAGMQMTPPSGSSPIMLWQMVLPHLGQILGGGAFIWVCRSRLEVHITSKEQAAESRELDRQLRRALDDAAVGIALSLTSNRTRYVNSAFMDILGLPRDSPVPSARELLALVHPADRDAGTAALSSVRAGERIEVELRVVHPDGAVRWVHARRSPVVGSTDLRATLLLEDVTDRVHARAAVAASERRFTHLANSIGVGISLRQLHPARFLWANAAYSEIVGSDLRQEPDGRDPAAAFVHPDDREAVASQYWPQAQRGELAETEFRILRRDGQIRWVHVTSSPVRDDDGGINQVAGTVQNVTARKRSEQILVDERRRLRQAETIGRVGSWERDLASGDVSWSPGMLELWGIEPTTFDGDPAVVRAQVHADDRPALDAALTACVDAGQGFQVRCRIRRADDSELRWIYVRGEAGYRGEARVRVGGSVADVTAQVLAEEAEAAARSFQQAIFNASPDVITVFDFEKRATTWANRSAAADLGYDAADIAQMDGQIGRHLVHPDDRGRFVEAAATIRNSPDDRVLHIDYRMVHKDGTPRWFSRRTAPLRRAENGQVVQVVGVIRDITDRMAAEAELRHSALHDSLTGLPNRSLLLDRIASALARADREDTEVAVLFCDLDGFKTINDTGGHAAGDAVLVAVADRLRLSVRRSDSIARVGGDEFVIILEPSHTPRQVPEPRRADDETAPESPEPRTPEAPEIPLTMREVAALVARRIRANLADPVPHNGRLHAVSISIGMTFAGRGSVPDEVLGEADTAMYLAKQRGRDRFEIYDGPRAEAAQRIDLDRPQRRAIDPPSTGPP